MFPKPVGVFGGVPKAVNSGFVIFLPSSMVDTLKALCHNLDFAWNDLECYEKEKERKKSLFQREILGLQFFEAKIKCLGSIIVEHVQDCLKPLADSDAGILHCLVTVSRQ
ncbi:hypothetical protein LOAG_08630 [Loa loa]|uniref:Uncharacterized protein n=1 Tax=Loa loa TaxID=7209 RepID=A0A1S0TTA7_LOALO|nr:hypothetical protein LOAG_08630 [Loa loa]EFO19862.1 hypothetical protein LOAG_08630 [Loa loa]